MARTDDKSANEAGASEVQEKVDQAEAQGFIGEKVDPRDNSEYSLESGPDSPSAADQAVDALKARVDALEASQGRNQ